MQDDFLGFFLDLVFEVLNYLMLAEHWVVIAQNACDAFDRFMVTTTHHAIMTIVLPWIFSTTVRVAEIFTSVCCGGVHRLRDAICSLCALIKAALVVALWIAYAHVVVVYLLVENTATWIIRSLQALVVWVLRFATTTVVLVHYTTVSLASYLLVCTADLFSTVSATLSSVAITTYCIATGFVIFPYIAWMTSAWAFSVLMCCLRTLLSMMPRISKTASVAMATRTMIVASATSIHSRATNLVKLLYTIVCSLVEFIQRHSTCFVAAVDFVIAAAQAIVSQTAVFLHAIRVVYCDRVFHSADKSATWSFLCVLLVPSFATSECGWSAVRLGVQLYTATSTTPTPTEDGQQEQHEDRATSELLAPGTEARSKPRRAWTLRLETRMAWICEVLPVARPMGTVSWARYSALSPVPVDRSTTTSSTTDEATAEASVSTSIVTRLPSFGPARPPFLTLTVPAIVASFLKAARNAFLRNEGQLMPVAEEIMAVTEAEHMDEVQIEEAQDETEIGGEAVLVVDEDLVLLHQQLFLPVLELRAVHDHEPLHQPENLTNLDALREAAVDVEAEVDEQPGQDHDDEDEDDEEDEEEARQPLAFAQVEAPLVREPLQPPLLRRIPPPRVVVRLPLLRNVVVRPERPEVALGAAPVDRAEHADQVTGDGARADPATTPADGAANEGDVEAAHGEVAPANLVVNHGYDYDRDADSRYRKYRETPAYRKRRDAALATRRKRGNVRPSPLAPPRG